MSRMERHKGLREDIKKGNVTTKKRESSVFRKEVKSKPERNKRPKERMNNYESYDEYNEEELALTKKEQKKLDKQNKKGRKKKRSVKRWILIIFLILIIGIIGNFLFGMARAATAPRTPVENFAGRTSANGANNILIIGTDQRNTQESTEARSDSIMILQLDGPSGQPRLLSIMRDTLVHIPDAVFNPDKINSAYTIGEQNNHQGAELLRQTIELNFGIDVRYYVQVDFQSFADVIDALFPRGVQIDAQFGTVDGQHVSSVEVPDDLSRQPGGITPVQTIHVGNQRMNGQTLLNYARFRHDDDNDFGRVQRQQQVLTAIVEQLRNPAIVFNGPRALGEAMGYVSTNVPSTFILQRVLGVLLGGANVERMSVPLPESYTTGWDAFGGEGLQIIDIYDTNQRIADFLGQ